MGIVTAAKPVAVSVSVCLWLTRGLPWEFQNMVMKEELVGGRVGSHWESRAGGLSEVLVASMAFGQAVELHFY